MTSPSGVSSSTVRSGSVMARAACQTPMTIRATPTPPTISPRTGNGRNCSVTTSRIAWAGPPGWRSFVTCRITWAPARARSSIPMNASSSQRFTPMPGWSQRRSRVGSALESRATLGPLELAVEDLERRAPTIPETAREILGDDHRSMPPPRAADPDREPALALGLERRDAEVDEVLDLVDVLDRPRLCQDERAHLFGEPGVLAEVGHVVRVLDEPCVEDEIGFERDPELVAESHDLDGHPVGLDVAEAREQPLSQVAQRQVRRVEDDVGLGAD